MPANPDDWKKAKKLCRLNEADIRAAKELGFRPKALIRNIPNKDQQWKLPVKEWIWDLWETKIGAKTGRTRPASSRPKSPHLPRAKEWWEDEDVPF